MMKRMVFLLAVLGTLLSGCGAPAPGGSASSAPQEGSSAQEELPDTEGESSVPLEEEPEPEPPSRRDSIPFTGDQLYAAAYLGFEEMEDLSYYTQRYLDSGDLPIHYFSPGNTISSSPGTRTCPWPCTKTTFRPASPPWSMRTLSVSPS